MIADTVGILPDIDFLNSIIHAYSDLIIFRCGQDSQIILMWRGQTVAFTHFTTVQPKATLPVYSFQGKHHP